jgi:hypothetical protein
MAGDKKVGDASKGKSGVGYGEKNQEYEFGGPIGAAALMIWSHCNLFYFWYDYLIYR